MHLKNGAILSLKNAGLHKVGQQYIDQLLNCRLAGILRRRTDDDKNLKSLIMNIIIKGVTWANFLCIINFTNSYLCYSSGESGHDMQVFYIIIIHSLCRNFKAWKHAQHNQIVRLAPPLCNRSASICKFLNMKKPY